MKKSTRALFMSAVSLVLCVSMLLGTTYAWFTDSVESGVNKIIAGNLDVELYYANEPDGNYESVESVGDVFVAPTGSEKGLWEPGHTEVAYLKVVNNGDLALKYSLQVKPSNEVVGKNADGGDIKLSEILKFGATEPSATAPTAYTRESAIDSVKSSSAKLTEYFDTGSLAAGKEHYVALVVYMPETVGNEANYRGADKPEIDFAITLFATQEEAESDSFDSDYDNGAFLPTPVASSVLSGKPTVVDNKVSGNMTVAGDETAFTAKDGLLLDDGVDTLTLEVTPIENSQANIVLSSNEISKSADVHLNGMSENNTVPAEITLYKFAPAGLNLGNFDLYHVENGNTVTMTVIPDDTAFSSHNEYKYDPATGDVTINIASCSEIALVSNTENAWAGNFDYSWYNENPNAETFTIANADQLAAFGAIVGGMDGQTQDSFAGKTVNLISSINIGDVHTDEVDASENGIVFYPIGYWNSTETYIKTSGGSVSSGFNGFEGTFDGNGNLIANFYQNTWEMFGDYNDGYSGTPNHYRDGMGLFGKVYKGTVKNLNVANFSSDGEFTTTGVIAAYAEGATFENIAIFNCNPRVYNIGNGGIVGCIGWYAKEADLKTTLKNITVDNSNKISALWGSWDVACGGLVGQYYPTSGQTSVGSPKNGGIHFDNCHVAAQIDVYNDVCANYQYYAYRYAGMLIGSVRENLPADNEGHIYPNMNGITADSCSVHFGDWNDYYYCELVANSLASYTHDHQMSRLTQVTSVDVEKMQVTDLDGKTTAIPTSGRVNYVVVLNKDLNDMWIHGDGHDYAECYHFVNGVQHFHDVADTDNPNPTELVGDVQTLKEDKQLVYREFNNLVTGYGWGVTSRGFTNLTGVTNLDINSSSKEESVNKFSANNVTTLPEGVELSIGGLFTAINQFNVKIKPEAVYVGVDAIGDSGVTGKFVSNPDDWRYGTLELSGVGSALITIQDYYYCNPTTLAVTVTEAIDSYDKFVAVAKPTVYKGLELRVGDLFTENPSAPIKVVTTELLGDGTTSAKSILTFKDSGSDSNMVQGTDYTFIPDVNDWKNGKITISKDVGTEIVVTINDGYLCNDVTNTFTVAEAPAAGVDGIISEGEYTNALLASPKYSVDRVGVSGQFYTYWHETGNDNVIEEDLIPNPTSAQFFLREDAEYIYVGYREENVKTTDTVVYFDINPRYDMDASKKWSYKNSSNSALNLDIDANRGTILFIGRITGGSMNVVIAQENYLQKAANGSEPARGVNKYYTAQQKAGCTYGVNVMEFSIPKADLAAYASIESYELESYYNEGSSAQNFRVKDGTIKNYTESFTLDRIGFRAFGQNPGIGYRETFVYGVNGGTGPVPLRVLNHFCYFEITLKDPITTIAAQ